MERWRNFDCYNFLFFLRFNVEMFMISKITTNPIKKTSCFSVTHLSQVWKKQKNKTTAKSNSSTYKYTIFSSALRYIVLFFFIVLAKCSDPIKCKLSISFGKHIHTEHKHTETNACLFDEALLSHHATPSTHSNLYHILTGQRKERGRVR